MIKRQLIAVKYISLAAFAAACLNATAATRDKANNQDNLNLGTSWLVSAPTSADIAQWTNTVAGANATLLGGDRSWLGIKIVNPGGAVSIAGTNTLTLGGGGVDMTLATQDLTLGCGLTLLANAGQDWNVASGRTLAITGSVLRSSGCAVAVKGSGTVSVSSFSNGATGIIAPWATFGAGTSAKYATVSGGNIAGYSGTPAATAANVTDTTGALNYDVAAIGTLGAGASFNTLRYTGAAGTIAGAFQANGLLNAGAGDLTLSGNATIGPNKELVLTSPDTTRTLTLRGAISDSAAGASGVTKAGAGIVSLYSDSSYSGETFVGQGNLAIDHSNSLGSVSAGTTIYTGVDGQLQVYGGITVAEPLFFIGGENATYKSGLYNGSKTNTLTGPITLRSSARFNVAANTRLDVAGGVSTLGASQQLVVNSFGVTVFTNKPVLLGSTGVFYTDSGGLTVLAVAGNEWTTTTIGSGTLRTDLANTLPSASTFNIGLGYAPNGTVDLNGFSQIVGGLQHGTANAGARVVTSATAATLTVNQSANTTFNGRMTNALTFVKGGSGTLTLQGTNTYTGGTFVYGGTLKVEANTGSLPAGGALTFNGTGTFNSDNTGATATLSPSLGALTLAAGDATVQSTRTAAQNLSLTFSSLAARSVGATGNFVASGGVNGTENQIVLTGTAPGFMDQGFFFGGSNYAYMNAAGTYVRAPVYGTDSGFTTAGTITADTHVKLTATPAATNSITLNTLLLSGGGVGFTLNAGQTLTLANGGLLKAGAGAAAAVSGGTGIRAGSGVELVVRTDASGDDLTIGTPVLANGVNGLTKTGAGMLTIAATNTYTGPTTLNAGVLRVATVSNGGAAGMLGQSGSGASNLVFNGGTLRYTGATASTDRGFTLGMGGGTIDVTNGTYNIDSGASTLAFSGSIPAFSSGNLTKTGYGTLSLTASNAYDGVTVISQGSLNISHASALGSTAGGTIVSDIGARLQLSGNITLAEPLTLNRSGIANSGALRGISGVNTVVSPIIVGSGQTRVGASSGTLILAGGVTRSGSATTDNLLLNYNVVITNAPVNMGVGGIETVGSGNVLAVTNNTYSYLNAGWGTSLRTDVAGALCPSGTLEMGGRSSPSGSSTDGTLNLNGFSQTVSKLLTPSGSMGTNAQNRIITSAAAATLTVNQSADSTYDGRLTGALSLTKTGAGTLTLSGTNNTCTGAMTVGAGTLKLAANNALSSAGSVSLAGGTLDVSSCTNAAVSLSLTADSTLALGTNGQVAFTAQTAGAWNGQLTLTGTLGPTSLRFQPALTADQLARIRYDGKSVMQGGSGYIHPYAGTLIRFF
jgi:autotransporter-associated beta strand protein